MNTFTAAVRDGTIITAISSPTTLALSNGNVVVAWRATESGNIGLYARVFTPDGEPVSDAFHVESTSTGTQDKVTLVETADGGFLFGWNSNDTTTADTSDTSIRARQFSANGTPAGDEFLVNTTYNGEQADTSMTLLADGRILVTWSSDDQEGADQSNHGVRGRFINTDGTMTSADFLINTTYFGPQWFPKTTALADGGYVVTWLENATNGAKMTGTVFNADGTVVGTADMPLNSLDLMTRSNRVAALPDGGFVISYDDQENVYARIFDKNGNALGGDFVVGTEIEGGLVSTADMTVMADGRIFFTWTTQNDGGDLYEIRGRLFEANGTPVGDMKVLRSSTDGLLALPAVDATDDGEIILTYVQGTPREIVVQVFNPENVYAPEELSLSKSSVNENAKAGTVVGELSATDADGDAVTWSLDGGDGKFELVTKGGVTRLVVDGKLDYETQNSYTVTLTASDGENETSQEFTIAINDMLEQVADTRKNDKLVGSEFGDRLVGKDGNDKLRGLDGEDILIGGKGADKLVGGNGADTFEFNSATESTKKAYDTIVDFNFEEGDRIDLASVDANAKKSGNQDFKFIGDEGFSRKAGELQFDIRKGNTFIEGDTNGDGKADFVIRLNGVHEVTADYFIF
ncbi:M10 family metallopeptidase C-terminal domain-containing protein [Rhizobium sp.]